MGVGEKEITNANRNKIHIIVLDQNRCEVAEQGKDEE